MSAVGRDVGPEWGIHWGIHWFRRDLRVQGNPALSENVRRHGGRVVGVFFFDSTFLARPDFSHNRFGFFLETLVALRDELRQLGGDLLVLDAQPREGFPRLVAALRATKKALPRLVSFNRDYEPFARERDAMIERLLQGDFGLECLSASDHLLLEPADVRRPDGGTYQVFTPFSRAWGARFKEPDVQNRLRAQKKGNRAPTGKPFSLTWPKVFGGSAPPSDQLDTFVERNRPRLTVPLPTAGSREACRQLLHFRGKLAEYAEGRNFPAKPLTSGLSIYLKNGSLSTAQIFVELGAEPGAYSAAKPFLRQLIWREFYFHILFHHPWVEKGAFREKYRELAWKNRADHFEAWKLGQTGYPIVDAGMRQLLTTGFMHNRLRMIVASFLTKDLLIDWRWGEQWFMQNLLDGDLAANNGGWQWAASTGCDPQPYFRIFNPLLQSRRFDPAGEYIRRYVPELEGLSARDIHEPPAAKRPSRYPAPVVEHAKQKALALAMYRKNDL